jgi:hypothetical protein
MTRTRKWSRVPGTTVIDYDSGEECTPLCFRDLDVQGLVIEWESSGEYDPGRRWGDPPEPPEGWEERRITTMTAVFRGGATMTPSKADREELESMYQGRIDHQEFDPTD